VTKNRDVWKQSNYTHVFLDKDASPMSVPQMIGWSECARRGAARCVQSDTFSTHFSEKGPTSLFSPRCSEYAPLFLTSSCSMRRNAARPLPTSRRGNVERSCRQSFMQRFIFSRHPAGQHKWQCRENHFSVPKARRAWDLPACFIARVTNSLRGNLYFHKIYRACEYQR